MTINDLERHLWNWANWMQHDDHKLGYPSKSAGFLSGGGSSADEFEIMCETGDIGCAVQMNVLINGDGKHRGLPLPMVTAINHKWLNNRHHYPTHELDYVEAVERLMYLANKRGLQ
jgi:hypothetical protein